ncbi:MAG: hypothetical protein CM15mP31_2150 [Gammaproteobacteria bacterium]|nr:MAG: hypothetical protein CM15mP31_2150 [Gammaproteobacteria bacterium]
MHIGEKVNNQKYLALIILLTPLLVISLSTATFYLGYKPTSSNNNGELVIPQIETQNLNLIDAGGNAFNFSTGKWYLVHFDDFQNQTFSLDRYKLATSLKITLPRESHRLRRVVVYKDKELFANALELKEQFPQIIFLYDKDNMFENRISSQLNNPYFSKSMFLIDSFSNVMEEFNVNLTFSEIFEDLKVLL